MASKKSSGRTNKVRAEKRAEKRAATNPRTTARAAAEPKLTREDRQKQREEEKRQQEERRFAGARLGDFLADYGTDEAGRPITDPEHSLRQAMSSDESVRSDILERYQIHQLPFGVKEELGLTGVEPKESLPSTPRGGLAAGEKRKDLSDVVQMEDDENAGVDTGVLSSQLGAGGTKSAYGKKTIGELAAPAAKPTKVEKGGPVAAPGRRRAVLPRLSQVRKALQGSEMGVPEGTEGKVTPKDVAESRRLSDVPSEPRWTDLGLAPTTRAVRGVRQENVVRRIVGESAVRMHLEQQANPQGRIEIPRSFNIKKVNPAFMETASYLAENEGNPSDWSPETKEFFRRHGMSGIAAGSTVGGTSIKGSDAVTRKVNTTKTGQVVGQNPQLIMTGTSKRFPKGAIIDVNKNKLSNQFEISNIDLATGETIRRPEVDIEAVPGTTPASGDERRAEFGLANPLDVNPPHPMDPDYKPHYALVDIPIRGEKEGPETEAAKQEAAARAYQTELLKPKPEQGKKGAQPWQTGVRPTGSGKITQPPYGTREVGSGAGMKPEPGPGIQRMAQEAGMPAEEALTVVRELGGRKQAIEELMDPIGESIYGAHDINRKAVSEKPRFATPRRVQIPNANKGMKRNPKTGAMERATTGYEVWAPTAAQLDEYLDSLSVEPGSKREREIINLMDTGAGGFVGRKMTKKELAEPNRDTSTGGKRQPKLIKERFKRPLSGQFSAKSEAEIRAGEQRRTSEADVITGRQKELRTGANKEYDTTGYIQGWDKMESVIGRQIMPSTSMDARDFSSRLLGTDIEQFEADQTGKAIRSTTEMGVAKRPGDTYNRPKFFKYSKNANPSLPDTSPGGRPLYDERMATPFAAFSTMAPARDVKPAVSESPQLGEIYSAATGHRLGASDAGSAWISRPAGAAKSTKKKNAAPRVPDVMDKEAFAAYQANKAAAASAPATPKVRGKKAAAPAAEAPAPAPAAPAQPAKMIKSQRTKKQ